MHEKLDYVTTLSPEIIERAEKELGVDEHRRTGKQTEVGRISTSRSSQNGVRRITGNRRIFPKTQRRLKFNFFLHLFKTLYD
jgi:hypothetical protein